MLSQKSQNCIPQLRPIPGAKLLLIEQMIGNMKLTNFIITYGGETFVESVGSNESPAEHLEKLENVVKTQMEKLREFANLKPLNGILSLPDELLLTVFKSLDAMSLARIGMTCRQLNILSESDDFWKKLYLKVCLNKYIKNNYKQEYISEIIRW
jgi:hypothetical protein